MFLFWESIWTRILLTVRDSGSPVSVWVFISSFPFHCLQKWCFVVDFFVGSVFVCWNCWIFISISINSCKPKELVVLTVNFPGSPIIRHRVVPFYGCSCHVFRFHFTVYVHFHVEISIVYLLGSHALCSSFLQTSQNVYFWQLRFPDSLVILQGSSCKPEERAFSAS